MQSVEQFTVDAELMHEFFTGSEEHLAGAEAALVALEKNPQSVELINDIFRHFHSLKGDASSIGIDAVRDLAHATETLLDRVRERELALSAELIDLIFEALSAIAVQIRAVGAGEAALAETELVRRLAAFAATKPQVLPFRAAQEKNSPTQTTYRDEVGERAHDNGETTYITFRAGNLLCAIDVVQSNEIISQPYITPVPNVENFIEGVINLRGSIVPVIHLAHRLSIPSEKSAHPQILILVQDGFRLGLLVDEVLGVCAWPHSRLLNPESAALELSRTFVKRVVVEDGKIFLLLNIAEILHRDN